jgi:hypothetical protein
VKYGEHARSAADVRLSDRPYRHLRVHHHGADEECSMTLVRFAIWLIALSASDARRAGP